MIHSVVTVATGEYMSRVLWRWQECLEVLARFGDLMMCSVWTGRKTLRRVASMQQRGRRTKMGRWRWTVREYRSLVVRAKFLRRDILPGVLILTWHLYSPLFMLCGYCLFGLVESALLNNLKDGQTEQTSWKYSAFCKDIKMADRTVIWYAFTVFWGMLIFRDMVDCA